MTTNIWTEFTGYDFGTYPENELLSIDLPVNTQLTNVTYTLISGNLRSEEHTLNSSHTDISRMPSSA